MPKPKLKKIPKEEVKEEEVEEEEIDKEEVEEEEIDEEEVKTRFVMEEISTQTTPVIKDTETNEKYALFGAIMKILENQSELLSLAKE